MLALGAKTCVSGLVIFGGFRALSDDDFSRIVIAQRFAEAPSLDPSGTSWLPLPFWINGAAMLLFGSSVSVARAVAIVLGLASVLSVWLAARWLGASRPGACLGALVAGSFPYSAWLGVAALPELPSAALALLGVAALSRTGRPRLVGALALSLACLCRYEAWPVALVFALYSGRDALRSHDKLYLGATLLALCGPAFWLANGLFRHGSGLFFVKRVSDYRRAIGAGNRDFWDALVAYPSMLLRAEPELVTVAVVGATALLLLGHRAVFERHARAALASGGLLVFLVMGDLRDGAPTHHGERALMTIWLWLAVFAGDSLSSAWRRAAPPARALLIASTGLITAPATAIVRPWFGRRDTFIDRAAELEAGRAAAITAGPNDRLLVDTPDFAFYAVMAGFARPSRVLPLSDHDPRHRDASDPFETPEALRARILAAGATLVLLDSRHHAAAEGIGVVERTLGKYVLVRVAKAGP